MTGIRRSPGPKARAASTPPSAARQSSHLHRPEDGYAAPTAEDRLDAEAVEAARARGFAVAVPCSRCGQWVVAPKSVALHMGPVCRAKTAEAVTE